MKWFAVGILSIFAVYGMRLAAAGHTAIAKEGWGWSVDTATAYEKVEEGAVLYGREWGDAAVLEWRSDDVEFLISYEIEEPSDPQEQGAATAPAVRIEAATSDFTNEWSAYSAYRGVEEADGMSSFRVEANVGETVLTSVRFRIWIDDVYVESAEYIVRIDRAAPLVRIDGVNEFTVTVTGNPVVLNYTARDDNLIAEHVEIEGYVSGVDRVEYVLEKPDMIIAEGTGMAMQVLEADGVYRVRMSAEDAAGNRAEIRKMIIIDTESPVIRRVDELDGTYRQSFMLEYALEDMISDLTIPRYAMSLNSEPYNGTYTDAEGEYVFALDVTDEAGNTARAEARFMIDRTPPKIVIEGVEDGGVYEQVPTVKIYTEKEADEIRYVKVNGDEIIYDEGAGMFLAETGCHELEVKAVDLAGNESVQKCVFSYGKSVAAAARMRGMRGEKFWWYPFSLLGVGGMLVAAVIWRRYRTS